MTPKSRRKIMDALFDAMVYGTGWMMDGKRIDPNDIYRDGFTESWLSGKPVGAP